MTEERLEYLTQKREMVLEKLKPLCEYFGIKYDYETSDGKQTETLVLNGTRIGCTSNSFQGILDEVIGYIFINVWVHDRSLGAFSTQTQNVITRYWLNW